MNNFFNKIFYLKGEYEFLHFIKFYFILFYYLFINKENYLSECFKTFLVNFKCFKFQILIFEQQGNNAVYKTNHRYFLQNYKT